MNSKSITADIRVTGNEDEMRSVQRFKYDVYVEEMGRYGDVADHDNRLLIEPDDAASHVFVVIVDGKLAGTMRLTCGGDGALHQRQIDQYDLAPFLDHMPIDQMVVGERFMIAPAFRGTDILFQMFTAYFRLVNERRIQMIFGDCEPHLLNTYQALGFRTYTDRNVNSPATGYLIPLVIVAEDVDYLRRIDSPLAGVAQEFGDDSRVPDNVDDLLAAGAAVQSERMLDSDAFLAEVKTAAAEANALGAGLFAGMDEEEITTCVEKSVIIACKPGDRVIKQGNVAKNMGMVLSGYLDVCAEDNTVARIGPGDVFGEIAFFLKMPRTMDLISCDGGTRILSFNERTFRKLMAATPEIAAKLLYNISIMLCQRVDNMNKRS